MKKSSIAFVGSLIISTAFLVNCQQAGSNRKVTPKGAGSASTDQKAADKKIAKEACSSETVNAYKLVKSNYDAYQKKMSDKNLSDQDRKEDKALNDNAQAVIDNCDKALAQIKANSENSCLLDVKVKTLQGTITEDEVNTKCQQAGSSLFDWTGTSNKYSESAKVDKQIAADNEEAEKYLKQEFVMSTDAQQLLNKDNSDWKKVLINGEIKNNDSINDALKTNSVICSVIDIKETIDPIEDLKIQLIGDSTEAINKLKDSKKPDGFSHSKPAIYIHATTKGENATLFDLACLNLEKGKLKKDKLMAAFKGQLTVSESAETETPATAPAGTPEAKPAPEAAAPATTPAAVAPVVDDANKKLLDQAQEQYSEALSVYEGMNQSFLEVNDQYDAAVEVLNNAKAEDKENARLELVRLAMLKNKLALEIKNQEAKNLELESKLKEAQAKVDKV